jgi:SOS-response transcriptional repressor LexA
MDVYARRRARLALLVEHMNQGNIASFGRDYGYSRSQISQFLSSSYNGGRSIGERAARAIEKKCGNPSGWLDQELSEREAEMLEHPFSTAELRVIADRPLPGDSSPYAPTERFTGLYIQGTIAPGKDGFSDSFDHIPPETARHLDLYVHAHSLVAIQIKGSNLRPRVKNEEYIIADSSRDLVPGDDVIVTFADGKIAILQFLYSRGGETTYGNVNDGAPSIVVPSSEIVFAAAVVGVLHSETKILSQHSQENS